MRGWAWPAACPQSSLGHSARAQLPTAAQDRGPGAWDLGHPRACGEPSSSALTLSRFCPQLHTTSKSPASRPSAMAVIKMGIR